MLVSVIIPCYNSVLYLEETLNSVINQTHQEIEIICVDNGSSDGTIDLIKGYQESNSNVYLLYEKTSGASYARNTGLKAAKGEFIQFLDSDDVIHAEKFEKQIRFLKKNDVDWVISDRKVFNENMDTLLETYNFNYFLESPIEHGISEIIITGNPLYRKSIVDKVNGYTSELKICQDWDFHLKLLLSDSKVGYLPGYFFKTRRLESSLSSNWIQVSSTLTKLIFSSKCTLSQLGVKKMKKAYHKIFMVYYSTAVHTADKLEVKFCIEEIKYWSSDFKPCGVLRFSDCLIERLLGIKSLIRLKRLFRKNSTQ